MALTALNLLSARKVETAQPRPKVYQLRDGGSLFLRVQPNGSKLWWYRYRLGGAEQVYSIGVYPKVTLEAARAERDRAKALVKKGLDPIVEKKAAIALQADLSEPGAGERLHRACREGGLEVDLLVNNAGSGLLGQSADLPPAALEAMAALNVTALTVLSSLFGRDMRDRGSGRILNVGSFAGLNATPYFAAYAATKSYVLSFSLALRAELKPRGVGVTCLLPGYVRTNFDAAAGIRSAKYLAFSERNAMDAADVARIGLRALARGRAWTVAGARNRLAATVLGLLPRAAAPALMKASLDGLLAKEGR